MKKNEEDVIKLDAYSVEVPSTHTPEMIEHETKSCLGVSDLKLTLGHVMSLHLLHSPYTEGGEIEPEHVAQAMEIIKSDIADPVEFHKKLVAEIESALRIYEIVVPEEKKDDKGKHSEIETLSPEWMADVVTMACKAMPSITYRQAMWEMPFAMMVHLGLAASRQYGTICKRPDDIREAIRRMREIRAQQAQQDQEN